MADKKCYIYRLEAGYNHNEAPSVVEFFYAPNAKRLIQYAQTMYRKEKYNKYKAVKIGLNRNYEPVRLISDFEAAYLKQCANGEFYCERFEDE